MGHRSFYVMLMARRYKIPRLVPNGTRSDVLTHAPSRKHTGRKSDKERLEGEALACYWLRA